LPNVQFVGVVNEWLAKGKDGKYLIYIPKDLAEDTMFPYNGEDSVFVKVSFRAGENKLLIEKWNEPRLL